MRILYGVVGEGMGHATRSRVILAHLLAAGHRVHVVVSGRAHDFLVRSFADHPNIDFQEIHGFHLVYKEDGIDKSESFWSNLAAAPASLRTNLRAYEQVVSAFDAEVVISDFESWAYLFARAHDLPVISIDNMQIINRCDHDEDVTDWECFNFLVSRFAVKGKLPHAYHYLITSFFFPPVRRRRTTLVPPILRPEILAAERAPGDHILVYQTADANTALLPLLQRLPQKFRVYGMNREGEQGNVSLRPFSQQGFIDDLRTAQAVIAGGGFSLMGEAVHLQVPMLSVPLKGQYEQELNARYLEKLGYGRWARTLEADTVVDFLGELDRHQQALARYTPRDNSMLLGCVDELLHRAALGEPRPEGLDHPSMGDSLSSQIAEALDEV